MNSREAKRVASRMLARYARGHAADDWRRCVKLTSTTPTDDARICRAFVELADELDRRASGERKPAGPTVDSAQLSWLDMEVMAP